MAANVETMFYTRVAPWHGLGVRVETALSSQEALQASGLDWNVIQRPIMTSAYEPILGYKANIRDTDNKVLGVVSDRYRVVQNAEAFAFTDALLGEGVKYETAGSLQEGRRIWLLAKLPDRYIIEGEQIEPYLVFSSSHDGSGRHQGRNDARACGVPEYPQHGAVHGKACLVDRPCGRPCGKDGRGTQHPVTGRKIYGETWNGDRCIVKDQAL